MRKRILLVFVVAALVFVGALLWHPNHPQAVAGSGSAGQPPVGLQIGSTAPDFTAKDVSGHSHSLSEYRGRPVLLNF
ncbi:MAG: redoxin domain-containing protein [Firmicutes bacterium]|nr:redoxin domain-containing protein [Bacillota bacterium]